MAAILFMYTMYASSRPVNLARICDSTGKNKTRYLVNTTAFLQLLGATFSWIRVHTMKNFFATRCWCSLAADHGRCWHSQSVTLQEGGTTLRNLFVVLRTEVEGEVEGMCSSHDTNASTSVPQTKHKINAEHGGQVCPNISSPKSQNDLITSCYGARPAPFPIGYQG